MPRRCAHDWISATVRWRGRCRRPATPYSSCSSPMSLISTATTATVSAASSTGAVSRRRRGDPLDRGDAAAGRTDRRGGPRRRCGRAGRRSASSVMPGKCSRSVARSRIGRCGTTSPTASAIQRIAAFGLNRSPTPRARTWVASRPSACALAASRSASASTAIVGHPGTGVRTDAGRSPSGIGSRHRRPCDASAPPTWRGISASRRCPAATPDTCPASSPGHRCRRPHRSRPPPGASSHWFAPRRAQP